MFPHFFGFDFSAALPWMLMGFVAGVLLTALYRWLSGGGARSPELQTALFDLNALRGEREASSSEISKLKSDYGFLETALADAERRAARAHLLEQDLAQQRQADDEARARFATASNEVTALRQKIDMYAAHSKTLEQRLQYYNAENTAISTASETRARELESLRSESTKLRSSAGTKEMEALRLGTEIAWFKSRLATLAEQATGDVEGTEAARLGSELAALEAALAAHKLAVEQGKRDISYYHDLAGWSAGEVYRLRDLSSGFESDAEAKAKSISRLESEIAALKKRAPGKLRFGLASRHGQKSRSVMNGAVGDHPLMAKPKRKGAPKALATTTKLKRRARLLNDASVSPRGPHWQTLSRPASSAGSVEGANELAALRERLAMLTAEVEDYRRFRDALDAANRVVSGGV